VEKGDLTDLELEAWFLENGIRLEARRYQSTSERMDKLD